MQNKSLQLNEKRIEEIKKIDPTEELFTDLLRFYLKEMPKSFGIILELQLANKYKEIDHISHRLRSTCYNIGATSMAVLFKDLEEFCKKTKLNKKLIKDKITQIQNDLKVSSQIINETYHQSLEKQ